TGVFLAQNIVLFYVFWEAVLIPMFFLIGVWGHEDRRHAALKFFIYTFAGSALMLIGILLAVYTTGETSIPGVVSGFQAMREYYAGAGVNPPVSAALVFWLLMIGLLVKVPAVPLHTWLPDAHVEAPTAGSVMLAGVLLKMGGYGMIRLGIPIAPDVFADTRIVFAVLGVTGILYGAVMALGQSDLKRLVAYSSVAHMGFALLALSTGTLNGQIAAVLIMISHGVVSALLFFLVGEVYDRTHTLEIDRFGGMSRVMPAWGTAFTFGALASLGLPGLSGFPGEFMAIVEGFNDIGWWILFALLGVVLAGAYNLRAVHAVGQGPVAQEWADVGDLDGRAILVVIVLAVLIIALGVWPRAVIDVATPALSMILGGGA
ncbi:MAG: NADH-quinone oxidoreductase subunit M, partial [Actinomycetota bacterium]|nr:NADH-quinone oxidoreductase subunit M [Actinomycetota bacterium]